MNPEHEPCHDPRMVTPQESCSCCVRDDVRVQVRLLCHPEVGLCDRCLLWLNGLRVAAARDRLVSRLRTRFRR